MKSRYTLGMIGTSLVIVGCFLPWEQEGDFLSHWTYGLRLFPTLEDNGGVLIIVLVTTFVFLAVKPLRSAKHSELLALIASAVLMFASLGFVARWLMHHIQQAGMVGAAVLEFGLIIVVIGSALLLWSAIATYRSKDNTQERSAG